MSNIPPSLVKSSSVTPSTLRVPSLFTVTPSTAARASCISWAVALSGNPSIAAVIAAVTSVIDTGLTSAIISSRVVVLSSVFVASSAACSSVSVIPSASAASCISLALI